MKSIIYPFSLIFIFIGNDMHNSQRFDVKILKQLFKMIVLSTFIINSYIYLKEIIIYASIKQSLWSLSVINKMLIIMFGIMYFTINSTKIHTIIMNTHKCLSNKESKQLTHCSKLMVLYWIILIT